jgi:hypothetical protein
MLQSIITKHMMMALRSATCNLIMSLNTNTENDELRLTVILYISDTTRCIHYEYNYLGRPGLTLYFVSTGWEKNVYKMWARAVEPLVEIRTGYFRIQAASENVLTTGHISNGAENEMKVCFVYINLIRLIDIGTRYSIRLFRLLSSEMWRAEWYKIYYSF